MKKTTILTQATIAGLCVAHRIYTHAPILATLIIFGVMQAGAVSGALWAARIRRRVTAPPLGLTKALD